MRNNGGIFIILPETLTSCKGINAFEYWSWTKFLVAYHQTGSGECLLLPVTNMAMSPGSCTISRVEAWIISLGLITKKSWSLMTKFSIAFFSWKRYLAYIRFETYKIIT